MEKPRRCIKKAPASIKVYQFLIILTTGGGEDELATTTMDVTTESRLPHGITKFGDLA